MVSVINSTIKMVEVKCKRHESSKSEIVEDGHVQKNLNLPFNQYLNAVF